jgi:hypothetical protein
MAMLVPRMIRVDKKSNPLSMKDATREILVDDRTAKPLETRRMMLIAKLTCSGSVSAALARSLTSDGLTVQCQLVQLLPLLLPLLRTGQQRLVFSHSMLGSIIQRDCPLMVSIVG